MTEFLRLQNRIIIIEPKQQVEQQHQSIDEQVAEPWAQIGEAQAQDREAIVPKVVFEPKSPGATVGDARKRIMEGKTLPGGFTTFIQKRFEGVT